MCSSYPATLCLPLASVFMRIQPLTTKYISHLSEYQKYHGYHESQGYHVVGDGGEYVVHGS